MNTPFSRDVLCISGTHSFLLAALVQEPFPLCIETSAEEYCQGMSTGDLVAVSAPQGGSIEPALMLLELVRTHHLPLIVLSKDHPGSKRIPYVVSAGPAIRTDCSIVRGTHPEQHLICASDELAGIALSGSREGIQLDGISPAISCKVIKNEKY
jgi:hypothetical protein